MRIDKVAPYKVNGVNWGGAENIPDEKTYVYTMTDDVHLRWGNFCLVQISIVH